jgi:hypothetical protein
VNDPRFAPVHKGLNLRKIHKQRVIGAFRSTVVFQKYYLIFAPAGKTPEQVLYLFLADNGHNSKVAVRKS